MRNIKKQRVAIIGAGVAGCFLAIILAKRGFTIDIYEKSSEKEITDEASKKSFNLTFYCFAVKAFKNVGAWNAIKTRSLPLAGSITHLSRNQTPIISYSSQKKLPFYTITRYDLLSILIKIAAKNPRIHIHFEAPLISINRHKKTLMVKKGIAKAPSEITYDAVFGADGVNSLTRSYLQLGQETQHIQEHSSWSYKPIKFSKELTAKLKLEKNFTYVWARPTTTLLAHPQTDGGFALLLILPNDNRTGYASLQAPSAIKKFIFQNYPHLLPAQDSLTDAILSNPLGCFSMIHTSPWYYKDFLAIVGDSSHGFFPFFGQGVSAAFGDCLMLDRLIAKYGSNWSRIFPLYEKRRKKHMDTLGDLSKVSFESYKRYKKADYDAVYERLENILHNLFPKYIISPLFFPIAKDPDHTADYYARHARQKKIVKLLGISLLVRLATVLVAIFEIYTAFYKKRPSL